MLRLKILGKVWRLRFAPNLANREKLPASPFRPDRWTDAVNAEPGPPQP